MTSKREPKRILILNRGEIASRIGKACRELGHIGIGVWTDNERNATHLEFCDEWVYFSGKSNKETYLNTEKVFKVIEENNIDAVHPGYGFLSEDYEFARMCEERGVTFIGPSSRSIELMSDKANAKATAEKAGLPILPGSKGKVETVEEAMKISEEIGFPVLIKATAGGGGRGLRVCHTADEFKRNWDSAKREAGKSFNDDSLIIEKYVINPHHIEIQILSNKNGKTYHFYERECSIQRKHQKIVEEAPSPFIGTDEELRAKMCECAVQLAEYVKYDNIGTVEFILDENKNFYFLEMNTRIQVEHTVTEEITGIDLVVCMTQVALGEEVGIPSQQWITKIGHAIECRICCEDPITLIPSPGKVTAFETSFPQGTRFDNCLYRDLEITPDFDPMVGKLVTKGIMRPVAIRKMRTALRGLLIEGIKTNVPLHQVIMSDETFLEGKYATNYLDKVNPQGDVQTDFNSERIYIKLAGIEAREAGL